jgi:hypothetical protein
MEKTSLDMVDLIKMIEELPSEGGGMDRVIAFLEELQTSVVAVDAPANEPPASGNRFLPKGVGKS